MVIVTNHLARINETISILLNCIENWLKWSHLKHYNTIQVPNNNLSENYIHHGQIVVFAIQNKRKQSSMWVFDLHKMFANIFILSDCNCLFVYFHKSKWVTRSVPIARLQLLSMNLTQLKPDFYPFVSQNTSFTLTLPYQIWKCNWGHSITLLWLLQKQLHFLEA